MVVDFPEPVGPVTRIRPCSRAPHRVMKPLGRSECFQAGHLGLDAAQDRTEPAHGAVQAYAVARMRARDEAGVTIHVAVALRVRAAGLPEVRHLRERHRFFAEHNDLFIDLKPRYLVLLEEYVARLRCSAASRMLSMFCCMDCNFYHTGRISGKHCLRMGIMAKLQKSV